MIRVAQKKDLFTIFPGPKLPPSLAPGCYKVPSLAMSEIPLCGPTRLLRELESESCWIVGAISKFLGPTSPYGSSAPWLLESSCRLPLMMLRYSISHLFTFVRRTASGDGLCDIKSLKAPSCGLITLFE